jgi:hypothetical protein
MTPEGTEKLALDPTPTTGSTDAETWKFDEDCTAAAGAMVGVCT